MHCKYARTLLGMHEKCNRECIGNIRGIYGDFGTIWDMVYQELGMRENYGKCGMGECGGYWIQWVEMSIIVT